MPLLLGSLLLLAAGITGAVIWNNNRSRFEDADPEVQRKFIELAVFLALEVSRSDDHLEAEEMTAIAEFLAENVPKLHADPKDIVARLMQRPTGPGNAEQASTELAIWANDAQAHFVLQLLAAAVNADGRVAPEESVFFHGVARQLGYNAHSAAKTYNIPITP